MSAGETVWDRLGRLASTRAFAYGSVLLIQLRAIWGIWDERDLTAGDTSSYFSRASRWADSLELDLVWSPLDSVVYGSLQWPFPDAFDVTLAYRLLAVFAATALVLAVLRRLLPDPLAWFLAVWWAVLPINFDTLYEVHLFSALPAFLAVLVAASRPGLWGRAAVFGILLAATLLVRNELILAAGAWAVAWLGYELWVRGRSVEAVSMRRLALAVLVPILVVGAVEAAVVARSPLRDITSERLDSKHQLNVCQIYAYGYQQRHDDFTGSPWTECTELLARDFGDPNASMTEAIRSNPSAMAEHFLWNVRLVPAGLQLMLFNGISGETTPDYGEIRIDGSTGVLVLSLLLLGLVAAGTRALWKERRRWWNEVVRERIWGWTALAALAVAALAVIVTQRPRPSYLFGLTLGLLALIGLLALPLISRWPGLSRLRAALPIAAVLVLLLLPSLYGRYGGAFAKSEQPLRQAVERLEPFEQHFRGGETKLVAASYPADLCGYVGRDDPCSGMGLQELMDSKPAGVAPSDWLDQEQIQLAYIDEVVAGSPEMTAFLQDVRQSDRWTRLGGSPDPGGWELLVRDN